MITNITFTGVADELGMNDDEYDFVDRLEVEEEDGSWQVVTILRHKISKGVCLFYGGSDYEGLPDTYTFVQGVLKDSDGDEIQTRVIENVLDIPTGMSESIEIGVDNPKDKQTPPVEYIYDVVDHETDMYMGEGVTPDWISDDLQQHLDSNI